MKNKKILIYILAIVIIIVVGFKLYNNDKENILPSQSNVNEGVDFEKIILENLNDSEKNLLEKIKEKLKKNPEDVDSLINLARLQKYNGDAEDSFETLKMAEKIAPDNVLILNNELDMLFNLKRYDEAEELSLKIIEMNSQWINAYRTLCDIYRYHKTDVYKTDKFPALVKKGMDADYAGVNRINFTALLASYYRDIENKKEAIEWYEKYYELSSDPLVLKELEEVKSW